MDEDEKKDIDQWLENEINVAKIRLYNLFLHKKDLSNNEVHIAYYLCLDPVIQTVIQEAIDTEAQKEEQKNT